MLKRLDAGFVICGADRVLRDASVLFEGATLRFVGPQAEADERFPNAERHGGSARERLVMPGLVNAHTHAAMVALRGLADDLPLDTWLREHVWPAERALVSADFVRHAVRVACAEMLLGGTTAFADMYFFSEETARVVGEVGMRALVAEGTIDFETPSFAEPSGSLAFTRAFVERWRGHGRVLPGVAVHAPYTCSRETLEAADELSRSLDVPLQIHLSETRGEVETSLRANGVRPAQYLASVGLLRRGALLAHCVWLDEEETALVAESGASVVHCPQSNMKLASGVAPVARLLRAGAAVALGTDGAASNNDLDMFEEMRTAALLAKVGGEPEAVSAGEAFEMATAGGARALGLTDVGRIEEGWRADLVCLDVSGPHWFPLFEPVSAVVYAGKAADVSDVFVDGALVVENGRLARDVNPSVEWLYNLLRDFREGRS